MTTYFIAGYSSFQGHAADWHFWRVMNIDDKKTPQDLIEEVYRELENSPRNYQPHKHVFEQIRGDVIITAFNKL